VAAVPIASQTQKKKTTVVQNMYEIIAYNVLFYFIPKELYHMKKQRLKIIAEHYRCITHAMYIHLTPFKHLLMKTYGEVDM
jgi:hypothetical protein